MIRIIRVDDYNPVKPLRGNSLMNLVFLAGGSHSSKYSLLLMLIVILEVVSSDTSITPPYI
jgi:hypothetical protein